MTTTLRDIPQVQKLLLEPHIAALVDRFGQDDVRDAIRDRLAELRAAILNGQEVDVQRLASAETAGALEEQLARAAKPVLGPVINATGIIIHTNLGRAPLAPSVRAQIDAVAQGACGLEFDLKTGERGRRGQGATTLLRKLTGAEDALVVNNCAAAVLLALTGLAGGREVIASRGELVEIGGAFRMPDVIAQSGAFLREVGTTNKTRISDYAGAIGAETAVLLKSHTSNFRMVGFTETPDRAGLAALAKAHDVVLIEDLGSGILIDLAAHGLAREPVVRDVLKSGVDLVLFSGDKLLGGPQAGILAGRADLIAALRAHPMYRALRADKMTLAGLEATLRLYLAPNDPMQDIPVLQRLGCTLETLRARAEYIVQGAGEGLDLCIKESAAQVGAGAMPGTSLDSIAIAVRVPGQSAKETAARLRQADTPVVGRIKDGTLLLDMRSSGAEDTPGIVAALRGLVA